MMNHCWTTSSLSLPRSPRGLGCSVLRLRGCKMRTCQENNGVIKPPTLIKSQRILLDVITAVTAGGISGCEIAKCNVIDGTWFQIPFLFCKSKLQFFWPEYYSVFCCDAVSPSVFRGGKYKISLLILLCIITVFNLEESSTSRSWSLSTIALQGDVL